jgi:molecular chaperone GrpE
MEEKKNSFENNEEINQDILSSEQQNNEENQQSQENEKTQETENETLLKSYNELNDRYLRIIAEYDNFRKRTLKEKMELVKSGGSDVLKGLLPVIDNFERALKSLNETTEIEAVKEGINLIYITFTDFMKMKGIQEIEALNLPLDTDLHEAIAQVPATNEETKGKIIDVVEKGYKLNDKILRFAKVVVAQ